MWKSYRLRLIPRFKCVRHFSDSCWKCGSLMKENPMFCPVETCGTVQPVEVGSKGLNLFQLFDIPPKFEVNTKELEVKFKNLQSRLHPDKFAMKSELERQASSVSSSTINQAYQVLKCPTSRVEYLLKLRCGIDLGNEMQRSQDFELNTEIFDLRESIADTEDINELGEIKSNVLGRINEYSDQFEASLPSSKAVDNCGHVGCCDECNAAQTCATRLKYYSKILEEVEDAANRMESKG